MEFLLHADGQLLVLIQNYIRMEWMTPIWKWITSLGNGGILWIALSVLLLIPRKTRQAGASALLSLAIGALLTNAALKNLVARTRPYEVVEGLSILIKPPYDYSFPSGHACASFAAAWAYYQSLPRRYGIAALVLAGLIAFSRLYVGVHYLTDVLAGSMIGIFAAWAASQVIARCSVFEEQPPQSL